MKKSALKSDRRKSSVYYQARESNPHIVKVMIEFSKIGEIDTMNEKYNAEVFIEAKWETKELIEEYDHKKNWNPQLYIENALSLSKEDIKYQVTRDSNNNLTITESRLVKGVFWERLELENFPIDVQELSISLSSRLSGNEVKLVSDPDRISYVNFDAVNTFTDQQKWRLYKIARVTEPESTSCILDNSNENNMNLTSKDIRFNNPKFVVSCYCSRRPGYYLFNAYYLIFLITVSSLTIFAIKPELPQNRLQTTFTLLLTSISFKWVINKSLPTISYLTSLDQYAIVCITFLCALNLWHAIAGALYPGNNELDKWLLICFSIVFILINLGFVIWGFRAFKKIRELQNHEKNFLNRFKSTKINKTYLSSVF